MIYILRNSGLYPNMDKWGLSIHRVACISIAIIAITSLMYSSFVCRGFTKFNMYVYTNYNIIILA